MPDVDRRRFLQLTGGTAALSMLTPSIARAASLPAYRAHGSLEDVEHVVVLMQENRAFDHYFGTLRGVRGYGDPHPAVLPSGRDVWHQPAGRRHGEEQVVLPFRPDLEDLGLAFLQDLDHSWDGSHDAFAEGRYDGWIAAKGTTTMAHLRRSDVPFHYALADAFTVCDGYHCSLLGPTDPNRYYLWSGWVGNDGKGGGPVVSNDESGYRWTTYPERLQRAGVSWKVYQDVGLGLDKEHLWGWTGDAYIGTYGDNALLYFDRYQRSKPGQPLYERARTGTQVAASGTYFDQLAADVQAGTLPQVSWVVAPEAFTEHPNWPANYGAWYVARVLDALTSNPDVWARTAVFLTFDENDGFFDHVVPPYPSVTGLPGASTVSVAHERYTGNEGQAAPYGLGVRVPMTVISPWSTGGWVCSEVFDHTSIIRFVEQRFGVHEPNITPWRRTVCGDLTAAFDFSRSRRATPSLPSTSGYQPPDALRHADYVPKVPVKQRVTAQERGTRLSRALGYDLHADLDVVGHGLRLRLDNRGRLGAHLQVRSNDAAPHGLGGGPWSYTLGAGRSLSPVLRHHGDFDVSVHGPNGFFRRFAGRTRQPLLDVTSRRRGTTLEVTVRNLTDDRLPVHLADAYRDRGARAHVSPGGRHVFKVPLGHTGHWYDVTLTVPGHASYRQVLAGRFETGRHSISDPQLGR